MKDVKVMDFQGQIFMGLVDQVILGIGKFIENVLGIEGEVDDEKFVMYFVWL